MSYDLISIDVHSGAHRAFDIDIGSMKDIYYRIIVTVTYPYRPLHNKETIFSLTDFDIKICYCRDLCHFRSKSAIARGSSLQDYSIFMD